MKLNGRSHQAKHIAKQKIMFASTKVIETSY